MATLSTTDLGSMPALVFALLCAIAAIIATITCIRTRRQLQAANELNDRRASDAEKAKLLLSEAIDTSPDGFIVFDENDVITLRNKAVDRVYGRFAEAIQVGNRFEDIVEHGLTHQLYRNTGNDPIDRQHFIAERIAIHQGDDSEFMYHGTDNRWVRVLERKSNSGYIVSVATELTEIKRTEEALRASEIRYRGMLEDQREFIVRFGPDLEVSYANPAYANHLGKAASELISSRLSESLQASVLADLEFGLRALTPENPIRTNELSVRGLDGQERWESWTLRGFFDANGDPLEYQGVGRDRSQEKSASDALVNSARLFRSIAEAHPIPIILGRVDDNQIVYANEASVPLLGPTIDEVLARNAYQYFVDKSTHDRFDAQMREHRAVNQFQAKIRSADGREFDAYLTARLSRYDDDVVVAVSITDTTEMVRTQEELTRQRQALAQSEKLSALGTLLASVSHELNNPLAIVVGQSQLLEAVAQDDDTRERAAKIGSAAKRSARIVKTFLSMVRQRPPTRVAVDLNDIISKSLEIAGYGLKTGGIELSLDLDRSLPTLQADEDQLIQVAVNLMINAQHAMQDHAGQRRLIVKTSQPDKKSVRLSVADSGPGVAPENQQKIFDAFFTTKAEGSGTGIGLNVSSNIVRTHSGQIRVLESDLGGALFEVDLPLVAAVSDSTAPDKQLTGIGGTTQKRILVIDDEPEIAATISEILSLDGYQTDTVENGEQALDQLSSTRYDLVLSDLWMPGMDGPAIYREIQARDLHPVDRMMFITGDSLSTAAQEFLRETGRPVIEKPFQPDDVRYMVQELLVSKAN